MTPRSSPSPSPSPSLHAAPDPSIWERRSLGPEAILLRGRVAVVTGSARGIGAATAIALARDGRGL